MVIFFCLFVAKWGTS